MLVWGEGACAKNGLTFPKFLSEIASYGFVVLADGPPIERKPGSPNGPGPQAGGPDPAPADLAAWRHPLPAGPVRRRTARAW